MSAKAGHGGEPRDAFDRAVSRDADRRRSRASAGLRVHAFWYVVVNVMLVGIWFFSSQPWGSGDPWFIWPLLGWGVGLASHWWALRGRTS